MYQVDLYQSIADDRHEYMLGGGACEWGEYADDGNIDVMTWPRAFSAAEVLWTAPKDRTITPELSQRFNDLSCKLRQLGIYAGPVIASEPCVGADKQNHKYAE